jgi:hypothetical protein
VSDRSRVGWNLSSWCWSYWSTRSSETALSLVDSLFLPRPAPGFGGSGNDSRWRQPPRPEARATRRARPTSAAEWVAAGRGEIRFL